MQITVVFISNALEPCKNNVTKNYQFLMALYCTD